MDPTLLLIATGAAAAIPAGLGLHHLFEGERLVGDILREHRLARVSLDELDAAWRRSARHAPVIVSLTTIPSRIGLIDLALKSLLDQSVPPERIVLQVPDWSAREGRGYEIPERIARLAAVEIRRGHDLGPATKAIPTLMAGPPDRAVLVVDDDRMQPRWFVERFDAASRRHPDAALTLGGWVVPGDLTDRPTSVLGNLTMRPPAPVRAHRLRRPRPVDVMLGVMGYLVRPRFFDLARLADLGRDPPAARLVDDVRTSALCRAPKLVIPAPGLGCLPKRGYGAFKRTALANLNRGDGDPETRNNTIAIRHFRDCWRVGGPAAAG